MTPSHADPRTVRSEPQAAPEPTPRTATAEQAVGPRTALPFVLAGSAALLVLGLVAALLSPGLGGPAAAAVAGGGLALLVGVGAAVALHRPQSDTVARGAVVLAMAAVASHALVTVALGGRHSLPMLAMVALVMPVGLVLADPRWLAAVAVTVWGALLGVLVGVAPPSAWPPLGGALAAATGLTVLLEAGRHRLVRRLARLQHEQEAARASDLVTGLASRRGLSLVASRMVEAARRQGDAVHCLFLEVGDLDEVVRRLGTRAADDVLTAVAGAVTAAIRGTDLAARWDEHLLCVVGPGVGVSPFDLERRVSEVLAEHPPVPPHVWTPSVTAASASLAPWDAGNLGTLLALGEQELYVRRVLRDRGVGSGRAEDRA